MSCPNEAQLIRLVSGELTPEEASGLDRHVRQCPTCAAIKEDLSATWATLGAWIDDAPAADLWPTVQATLAIEDRRETAWLPRTTPALLRAAACIAAAVGLGWATGAWIPSDERDPTDDTAAAVVDANDVLEPLGLDMFLFESSMGLQGAFDEVEPNDGQEEAS